MHNLHKLIISAALLLTTSLFCVAHASGVGDGLAGKAPKRATAATGDCRVKKTAYTASDVTGSTTTSTTYVDVPDGAVSFSQGGRNTSCVTVHFDAFSYAPNSALLYVQALLDGAVMFPGETQFSSGDVYNAVSHGFSWEGTATPGAHTVQIQFRSYDGNTVYIHRHMTTVQHQ